VMEGFQSIEKDKVKAEMEGLQSIEEDRVKTETPGDTNQLVSDFDQTLALMVNKSLENKARRKAPFNSFVIGFLKNYHCLDRFYIIKKQPSIHAPLPKNERKISGGLVETPRAKPRAGRIPMSDFPEGEKVIIKDKLFHNPRMQKKLEKYFNTTATIYAAPIYPGTWFAVKMYDGVIIKCRSSAFYNLNHCSTLRKNYKNRKQRQFIPPLKSVLSRSQLDEVNVMKEMRKKGEINMEELKTSNSNKFFHPNRERLLEFEKNNLMKGAFLENEASALDDYSAFPMKFDSSRGYNSQKLYKEIENKEAGDYGLFSDNKKNFYPFEKGELDLVLQDLKFFGDFA